MRTLIARITAGLVAFAIVNAAVPAELAGEVPAIEVTSRDAVTPQQAQVSPRRQVLAARTTRPRAHW